jgi:hypothetical protein
VVLMGEKTNLAPLSVEEITSATAICMFKQGKQMPHGLSFHNTEM